MIYAIALCIFGQCQMVMSQDMFPPHAGLSSPRELCLYWTDHFGSLLGSGRGPNYDYHCVARSSPWGEVQ